MDITLNANTIYVRGGNLIVGTQDEPFEYDATINLRGSRNSEAISFDSNIAAGNKVLANVGTVMMFGQERTQKMTRLLASCYTGDKTIWVETGLDLVAGDELGLAPTSYVPDAFDYVEIDSYDSDTGEVTLTSGLSFYHYGAADEGTMGIDMRGEVLLLTRNVKIQGNDQDNWGCAIVTSDTEEFASDESIIYRTGQMILHNVEVFRCSQIDTDSAAIRFESVTTNPSEIKHCAFHNGYGWGANVKSSENIIF